MPRTPLHLLRKRILEQRGLAPHQAEPRKHRRLRPVGVTTIDDKLKTPKMKYLELKYGTPIGELLLSGSLRVLEVRLNGDVDHSTLSRWIKRFKLRFSKDNLPDCTYCVHHHPCCDEGLCNLLYKLELWDLIPVKQKQLRGEP